MNGTTLNLKLGMLNKQAFSKRWLFRKKKENSFFSIHNSVSVKLLTRLRLQLSHEHRFRHGFEDTISPMCSCNAETKIKSNEHFLLRCHFYSAQRLDLFNKLNKTNSSFFKLSAKGQVNILLYGYSSKEPISLNEDIIKLLIIFFIRIWPFWSTLN